MASEPGTMPAQPESSTTSNSDQPIVDLVMVSPSVGVPQPLRFPGTPARTTIQELKTKIRETLAVHPAEENQRLIYRGRALVRDGDTLLEVLGADTIAADRQQTMHLVIREVANTVPTSTPQQASQATTTATTTPNPPPAAGPPAQNQGSEVEQYINMMQRRMIARTTAINQSLLQTQRERAQRGMRGIGDTNPAQPTQTDARDHRASPVPSSHTYAHEQVINGRPYRMETTSRITSNGSNGMSPADLQNLLQSADATQATLTMTNAMNNAMQRSSSSASMHSRPLTQPGVTVSIYPGSGSRAGSGRTTPFSGVPGAAGSGPRPGQEVYILSSPEGPRALLVNNATSETYYTPRLSTRRSLPRMHNSAFGQMFPDFQRGQATGAQFPTFAQFPNPGQYTQPHPMGPPQPQARYQHPQTSPQPLPQPPAHQVQAQQPVQPQAQGQPALQAPVGHGLGHPQMHPPVAAIPPLLRFLWPHLWLIFRLALFVYVFTSPGSSWSRWMMVIGVAVIIFIHSTGALNGIAEHIMQPVGRHLDNLLPALDGQHRRGGNAGHPPVDGQEPVAARPGQEPHPEQMAERLLNERRARGGWITGQFRRVERASLLFLASIAPGVAERHIAQLEAEAARQRREAEEAAAAATAAAAARAAVEAEAENSEAGGGPRAGTEANTQGTERDGQSAEGRDETAPQEQQREPNAAPEPLIAL